MQWLRVEQNLPPDGNEVLILLQAYFVDSHDILGKRKRRKIFHGTFYRRHGWNVPFYPDVYEVVAWMPKPNDLENDECKPI